ncbi:WcaI family glycosyltransferase [Arcticibacter sp. MXS-1]|uniref:WcaI family glycosyltransferase n=1 Tax=Arcticibacter sp. MXS-1 TaxID=3341726 RepID=UPI0035A90F17
MEVKKRILLLGINCFPELTGIGKYTGEMVQWLAENGYDTTVVTSYPYYPYWKVQAPYSGKSYKKETYAGGRLTLYRCPMYVPENPSGLKRLIHEATFFCSAFFIVFKLLFKKRNDLIFSVAPPFHLGFLALFYRFFKGGKIVYHIHDLQIEAARDLNMLKSDGIFSVLFALERFILKRVDFVSTVSEGMIRKVAAKVNKEVILFPNWVNTSAFYPLENRDQLKELWDYRPEDKVVLYSGSIGEKQGLESLISIAGELQSIPEIKFLICGTGPYKEKLASLAEKAGLLNMRFLPLQENDVFNKFLNMADVHLVLQKGDASDLMMPSKLTTILAVGGVALVTANEGTTLCDVMTKHRMGKVIIPESREALISGIVELCNDEDPSFYRNNARNYSRSFLDKEGILRSAMSRFFSNVS